MGSDSLIKGAFRSLINSFFKVVAGTTAFVIVVVVAAIVLSGGGPKDSSLIIHPDHNWKVKPFSPTTPTILYIPIVGVIGNPEEVTKDRVMTILKDIQEVDLKPGMFKAIVLYLNTPGGGADEAFTILNLLLEAKKRFHVPVYAYVDGMCASGGVVVSLAADKIMTTSISLLGSVGVITHPAFNFSSGMERIGIKAVTIYAGEGKDTLNAFRPWKENETEKEQRLINMYYDKFVKCVAQYRPRMSEEQIKDNGAQVFMAPEAIEIGFADQLKESYFEALEEVSTTLEISGNYQVIELKPYLSLSALFGANALCKGKIQHQVQLPGELPKELSGKVLYLYQ
jgi:signal peptide peptidase SppA